MTAYSILEQVHPSPQQRRAITELGLDTVVVAGAGAGKTRALVARYLALLEMGLPLRSIVAITFTIKAAREMRNRIRGEIARFAARPDLPPGMSATWQAHAAALDAARISTIHSLCGDILRSHPAEAGLDPRFGVLTPADAGRYAESVLDDVISRAADDPVALPLFELLGVQGLRSALGALLARRLDAEEARRCFGGDPLAHWRSVLEAEQQRRLAALLRSRRWREAAQIVRTDFGARSDDGREQQRRAAAAALAELHGQPETAARTAALAGIRAIKLTGGSARAWPDAFGFEQVKRALETLRELCKAQEALALQINALDETLAAATPPLLDLFDLACAKYSSLKATAQALDFDDLEDRALALLETEPAVRERWQREVAALLVDEYQDTNARQNRLVHLLAPDGAGKRFIVGDAKQSIYGFRGADVTVFEGEQKAMRIAGREPVSLDESYRAHAGLLDVLNALLLPVLDAPVVDNPWRVSFSRLMPQRETPGRGFTPPHLELLLSVGNRGDGAPDVAARLLAARLVDLVDGGACFISDEGAERALRWDDIAILCRSSGSFPAYEAAFEEAGIPFLTVAGGGFYNRPEIRDLLNALDAIADPTNDLALAGLLRSPAFCLSDAGLFRLGEARRAPAEEGLWTTLKATGPGLPGSDGPAAVRAVHLIEALHAQSGRLTVAALLKNLLDATGYQAALIAAGQGRAARNVEKLLADAANSALVSAPDFLEYIGSVRTTGVREGEARAADERAVQIMSVHAAKGLEFPVVVIGDAGRAGGGRTPSVMIDRAVGPVLAVKGDGKTVCAAHKLAAICLDEREAAESDRLLYVVATRAREKLIISGCVKTKDDGTITGTAWLKQLLGPTCLDITVLPAGADLQSGVLIPTQLGGQEVQCLIVEDFPPMAKRAGADISQPAAGSVPPPLLAPVTPPAEPSDVKEREAERRQWRIVPPSPASRAPSWVVGILVHEALAAWRFDGPGFEGWLSARGRERGMADAGQLQDAVDRAQRLLARFTGSPLYREMDAAAQRLHEVPYQALAADHGENGSIDALYLPQGESRWRIIEFKTDLVTSSEDPIHWLEQRGYLGQAQRYIRAIETLLGQRPHCSICLLHYDRRVHIVEVPTH